MAAFILRTAIEELTVQREFPGWTQSTQRHRYRLVPGLPDWVSDWVSGLGVCPDWVSDDS